MRCSGWTVLVGCFAAPAESCGRVPLAREWRAGSPSLSISCPIPDAVAPQVITRRIEAYRLHPDVEAPVGPEGFRHAGTFTIFCAGTCETP